MAPAVIDAMPAPRAPRRGFTDHALFGMALFVFTEVMMFLAFISGYLIVRRAPAAGPWPPPNQPRLPFEQTLLHTFVLLGSGVVLYLAHRASRKKGMAAAERPLLVAVAMGAWFVAAQGAEWVALIRQGLTLTSSQIGAFFYTIVGAHALHAIAAIVALMVCWLQLRAGRLRPSVFGATQLFWYFVVLIWPLIFLVVYR